MMNASNEKICNSLQGISNAILGFVVIQSISLSYHLNDMVSKFKDLPAYGYYIVIGQGIIVIGSIITLVYYSKKISSLMDDKTKKLLNPKLNVLIKIGLILYFGIIPILIILYHR